MQIEINRRLDIIKSITYQPPLLKKSDDIFFEDEHSPHSEYCLINIFY